MDISLVTWNINSVRLRMPLIEQFARQFDPDVICLQETKCRNENFPEKAVRKLGYEHMAINGQAGYHGVAILSRLPLSDISAREFCQKGDARHVAATIGEGAGAFRVHNFYVPAGGDEPDRTKNEKFGHKLDFLCEMRDWFANGSGEHHDRMVLVGDLNIAPLETDVWSHKQLLKVVSHTPIEVDHLGAVQGSHDWRDVVRRHIPPEEKLYTWWSYRARDWRTADKGRRLDHVWLSPGFEHACTKIDVIKDARGWEKTLRPCADHGDLECVAGTRILQVRQ